MQTHAGVFRDGPSLKEGCEKLAKIYQSMDDLKVSEYFMKTSAFAIGQISSYTP